MPYFSRQYLPFDEKDLRILKEDRTMQQLLAWAFTALFLLIFFFVSELFNMGNVLQVIWGIVVGVLLFFLLLGMRGSRKDLEATLKDGQKLLVAGTVSGREKLPMQYVKGYFNHFLWLDLERQEVNQEVHDAVRENDFVVLHIAQHKNRQIRYEIYPHEPALNEDPPLDWKLEPMSPEEKLVFEQKRKKWVGVMAYNFFSLLCFHLVAPFLLSLLLRLLFDMSIMAEVDLFLISFVLLGIILRFSVAAAWKWRLDRKSGMKKIKYARVAKKTEKLPESQLLMSDKSIVEPGDEIYQAVNEGELLELQVSARAGALLHAKKLPSSRSHPA